MAKSAILILILHYFTWSSFLFILISFIPVITMPETVLCPNCRSAILISDFENHFWNACSGKYVFQCQIGNCLQFFTTLEALYQHGREIHPKTDFFEETYVIVNQEIANSLCREISNSSAEIEAKSLITEDCGTQNKDNEESE